MPWIGKRMSSWGRGAARPGPVAGEQLDRASIQMADGVLRAEEQLDQALSPVSSWIKQGSR
jgi:hypothetical protein